MTILCFAFVVALFTSCIQLYTESNSVVRIAGDTSNWSLFPDGNRSSPRLHSVAVEYSGGSQEKRWSRLVVKAKNGQRMIENSTERKNNALAWSCHVIWMDHQRIPQVLGGSGFIRGPGGPRTNWRDTGKKNLQRLGLSWEEADSGPQQTRKAPQCGPLRPYEGRLTQISHCVTLDLNIVSAL